MLRDPIAGPSPIGLLKRTSFWTFFRSLSETHHLEKMPVCKMSTSTVKESKNKAKVRRQWPGWKRQDKSLKTVRPSLAQEWCNYSTNRGIPRGMLAEKHRGLSIHPGNWKLQSLCASQGFTPSSSFMSSFHTLQHLTSCKWIQNSIIY